jgi:hypothetical protein
MWQNPKETKKRKHTSGRENKREMRHRENFRLFSSSCPLVRLLLSSPKVLLSRGKSENNQTRFTRFSRIFGTKFQFFLSFLVFDFLASLSHELSVTFTLPASPLTLTSEKSLPLPSRLSAKGTSEPSKRLHLPSSRCEMFSRSSSALEFVFCAKKKNSFRLALPFHRARSFARPNTRGEYKISV